ncbi:hypothetical protein tb265_41320 [Gemmatimonadetes bacterium T265]|nr:hypothetical protein tb265_41320 [Gemmatimonadetes bacterium T265]
MSTTAIGGTTSTTTSDAASSVRRRHHHAAPPDGDGGPQSLLKGQTVDGLDLSDPGKLMQQLQQLGQTDPTQLKQTLSDIATKMRSVAQAAGAQAVSAASGTSTTAASSTTSGATAAGSAATTSTTGTASFPGTMLNALADKFDQAAQTGDLSSLMPPGPPRAGVGSAPGASSTGARAEAAYGAAGQTDGTPDATLQRLFKGAGANAEAGSTSDTDVERQIAALRQQIAALTASLSNGSAGGVTGVGA